MADRDGRRWQNAEMIFSLVFTLSGWVLYSTAQADLSGVTIWSRVVGKKGQKGEEREDEAYTSENMRRRQNQEFK